jgi:S1-C subfamily serine protease
MSEVVVRAIGAAPKLAYVAPKLDDKGRREVRSGFSSWFGSMPNYAWDREGVLLDGTSSGSPAEKAGLLKGDVLVKMDEVEVKDIYDFMWVLQTKKPGDLVQVGYLRDGQLERVAVTLGSRGAR